MENGGTVILNPVVDCTTVNKPDRQNLTESDPNGEHGFRLGGLLSSNNKQHCARFCASCVPSCGFLLVILFTLLWGKQYVKNCLLWLDAQEEEIVCVMFIVLYIFVAFPMTWGYILLNFACGYHFGLLVGILVTASAASVGISVAHTVMKKCFLGLITSRLISSEIMKSTLSLLESGHAFKVVVISRLTPIPFGLQNALFAASHISLGQYVFASAIGLVPTQVINVYLGTTVRSMEDVLADDNTAATGYTVLFIQVVLSGALMACIIKKAKKELQETMSCKFQTVSLDTKLQYASPWVPVTPLPPCSLGQEKKDSFHDPVCEIKIFR